MKLHDIHKVEVVLIDMHIILLDRLHLLTKSENIITSWIRVTEKSKRKEGCENFLGFGKKTGVKLASLTLILYLGEMLYFHQKNKIKINFQVMSHHPNTTPYCNRFGRTCVS